MKPKYQVSLITLWSLYALLLLLLQQELSLPIMKKRPCTFYSKKSIALGKGKLFNGDIRQHLTN